MRVSASVRAGTLVAPGGSRRGTSPARPRGVFALKPIGTSPAFYRKPEPAEKPKSTVARLFGGGEQKARIAQLEYELETERAHSSDLGAKLREAEGRLAKAEDSLELYKSRCKEQDKEIFALEAQLVEKESAFATGMSVAKRQIKLLEGMLEEEKKRGGGTE